MYNQYNDLATRISNQAKAHRGPRYLVAIAGIPGSGKTTAAMATACILNEKMGIKTTVISMDGFYLPKAVLDQLPNARLEHARRGAPWTFDLPKLFYLVRLLRTWPNHTTLANGPGKIYSSTDTVTVPSSDHNLQDPVTNGLKMTPDTAVIIIEGNYLLLDEPGWQEVSSLFDYRVFVDADLQDSRTRVAKCYVSAGIVKTLAEGLHRADGNEYLNSILILSRVIKPNMVLKVPSW